MQLLTDCKHLLTIRKLYLTHHMFAISYKKSISYMAL